MKKQVLISAIFSFFITILLAQTPSYLPNTGLVGWYPFTGNANDGSTNGNNGIVYGATLTTDRFGNINCAYSFDGISNYISSSVAPFTNIPFSISAWIKADALVYQPVVTFGDGIQNNSRAAFSTIANSGKLGLVSSGANDITSDSAKITDLGWHHIVIVCSGYSTGQVQFYVDGALFQTNNISGSNVPFPLNNTPFSIGRDIGCAVNCATTFAKGKLDDIGIWNRALTYQEVTQIYNANGCTQTVYDTVQITITDTIHVYDTTTVLIHDTVYHSISVTDTLVINVNLSGLPPFNKNALKVYPNPANDHLYINTGDFGLMAGYHVTITNALNQTVFNSAITQQTFDIDISAWNIGTYILRVTDPLSQVVSIKKLVLQ